MKKIFFSLIIIVVIVLAVVFGWALLSRPSGETVGQAINNVLPFGSGEGLEQPTTNNQQPTTGEDGQVFDEFGRPTAGLFRVVVEPVAGAVAFTRGTSTVVRYVDRATGHVYETNLTTSKKTRITNKTLPKIYESYFRLDGQAVLLRSLKDDSDTVENLSLALTPPKATSTGSTSSPQADGLYTVSATVLRGDIGSVAVGLGNTLFYSLRDSGSIVSSAFNNTALKTIFSSVFTDWRLAAAGNGVIIYTKASSNAPGYAYTLNTASGGLTRLLGPLNGLTVTPDASGTRLLYSYTESGLAKSSAKNLQSGAITDILPVTLSEKCIWSVKNRGIVYCGSPVNGIGASEPDNWYKGATHFSDRLWRFDTNAEIAQILSEPKASLGLDIDVVELKLSPTEDYLIFINKKDLSLWALRL